jgi:ATP-binding cassette subfamily F protein uup
VLIVSHDRYFIDRLVDHTFVLEGNGEIKDFPGNYTEYRNWKSSQNAADKADPEKQKAPAQAEKSKQPEIKPVVETAKKLSFKLQRELEDLEKEIPKLEKQKSELEQEIITHANDYSKVSEITEKLNKVSDQLDEKSMRWLEIQEMK